MWTVEHSIVTNAAPAAIHSLFADVATWPEWNKGIEWVTLDGPFAAGTHGQMKVPGQEPFALDRKSTRLNSSHLRLSRMPSSA